MYTRAVENLTETARQRKIIPPFLCEIEKNSFKNGIAGFTMCKCFEVTHLTQNGLCEVY